MRKAGEAELLKAAAAEIKARRALLGMSQEELAHRANLHRTFVGRIETGRTQLSMTGLFRVAAALHVPISEFMDGIDRRRDIEQSSAQSGQ
jgi:transcriptional regulator with XRE-family HTH domain